MTIEVPRCTCPDPITLSCAVCYPTFTAEQKAYVQGHNHAAYRWASTPPTFYSKEESAAYTQGYQENQRNVST